MPLSKRILAFTSELVWLIVPTDEITEELPLEKCVVTFGLTAPQLVNSPLLLVLDLLPAQPIRKIENKIGKSSAKRSRKVI